LGREELTWLRELLWELPPEGLDDQAWEDARRGVLEGAQARQPASASELADLIPLDWPTASGAVDTSDDPTAMAANDDADAGWGDGIFGDAGDAMHRGEAHDDGTHDDADDADDFDGGG
jgi:hypothetical protein